MWKIKSETGRSHDSPLMDLSVRSLSTWLKRTKKSNINDRDASGRSILLRCVIDGNLQSVKLLISYGANLEVADLDSGATVVHFAAALDEYEDHNSQLLSLLMRQTSLLHSQDVYGRTALHWAASAKSVSACHLLLRAGLNLATPDNHRQTPLHLAIIGTNECTKKKAVDTVRVLLENCEDYLLDWQDENGWSPLYFAVFVNCHELVTMLLEHRCFLYLPDNEFRVVLHCAAVYSDWNLMKLLLNSGNIESSEQLLDKKHATPLHYAALSGNIDIAKGLMSMSETQFDAVEDCDGLTPISWAVNADHMEFANFWLKQSDWHVPDNLLFTITSRIGVLPFLFPLLKDHAKWQRLLMFVDSDGCSCLNHSVAIGDMDTVQLLISSGCSVLQGDSQQRSCLHYIVIGNQIVMLKYLSLHFSSLSAKQLSDINGMNPLHWASILGHVDCLSVLIQLFPSLIGCVDSCGRSPMHFAALGDQLECAKLLYYWGCAHTSLGYSMSDGIGSSHGDRQTPLDCAFLSGGQRVSTYLRSLNALTCTELELLAVKKIVSFLKRIRRF